MKQFWYSLAALLFLLSLSGCREPVSHSMRIQLQGEGTVRPAPGLYFIEDGTLLLLEAHAEKGWEFLSWQGPVREPEKKTTSIIIDQKQLVTAVFVEKEAHQLDLTGSISWGRFHPLFAVKASLANYTFKHLRIITGWDPIEEIFSWWLMYIRSVKSPYLYWLFRQTIYRGDLPERWVYIRDLEKYEFEEILQEYPFRMDLGQGLFDFSPKEEDFFFLPREKNRDCDNWARMWFYWAQYNHYPVWEIAIINGLDISSAHMITIFKDEEGYNLCNYSIVQQYTSLEEAVEVFREKPLTASGPYTDLRWVIYQESIP